MVEAISRDPGVRIVPLLLDADCSDLLPAQLQGRTYLDLTRLVSRDIHLANVLAYVVEGATQAEIGRHIADALHISELDDKATRYFSRYSFGICGNAETHQVTFTDGTLLLSPKWMCASDSWSHVMLDDYEYFSPRKGIWDWDHWTPSRGMKALGTAICTAYFPERTSPTEIAAIEDCGSILAVKELSMIKRTEPFFFNAQRLTQILLSCGEGVEALTTLLANTVHTQKADSVV